MNNKLLIIESPNKINTISKYLNNKEFTILATIGHIRDLPSSGMGFDEKTLEPKWIVPRKKKNDRQSKEEIIDAIKKTANMVDEIYLATDPDREGEAISWHVYEILPDKDKAKCKRITFNEITKTAINEALSKPRNLDLLWVNSQFSRRLIDRLVGYKVSKVVKQKTSGKSAGRVQSVALKFIYDREDEIAKFVPKKWWTVDPLVQGLKNNSLILREVNPDLKDINCNKIDDEKEGSGVNFYDIDSANKVVANLTDEYKIYAIDEPKQYKFNPKEPYKTSTLQQDAINKLGWSVSKATLVAQKLYEGVKIGDDYVALISYPRTDSIRISDTFKEKAKSFVLKTYGQKYYQEHTFKSKGNSDNVQDAHEAIRVIDPFITPQDIKDKVAKDEYILYRLVWCRTISCFMASAIYENIVVRIINNKNKFYTYSRTLVFDGFKKVYSSNDEDELPLRDLKLTKELIGTNVPIQQVDVKEHSTTPPPRFNQASLIKELDNAGVGRPSTYKSMANMALERGYAELINRAYKLLPLGKTVCEFLEKYFDFILNVDFTSRVEKSLDDIADGKIDWKEPIKKLQPILEKGLKLAKDSEKIEKTLEKVGRACPNCGSELVYRYSKNDHTKFIGCSNYPKCKYAEFPTSPTVELDEKCPNCGHNLIIRLNKKHRKFVGCSNYPSCHYILKCDAKKIQELEEKAKNNNKTN